jgi:hypothetical protein
MRLAEVHLQGDARPAAAKLWYARLVRLALLSDARARVPAPSVPLA